MGRLVLIRHAEPLQVKYMPAALWPLSVRGRNDARALGRRVIGRSASTIVLTSRERRAWETAELAFPSVVSDIRHQLCEVRKPWYDSAEGHANAAASYLSGEVVEGWERREDVIARIAELMRDFRPVEGPVFVSHGVLITTWLDHVVGLDDPPAFWSHLQMPDVWEVNLDEKSLKRIP